jgi:hypothetical protein
MRRTLKYSKEPTPPPAYTTINRSAQTHFLFPLPIPGPDSLSDGPIFKPASLSAATIHFALSKFLRQHVLCLPLTFGELFPLTTMVKDRPTAECNGANPSSSHSKMTAWPEADRTTTRGGVSLAASERLLAAQGGFAGCGSYLVIPIGGRSIRSLEAAASAVQAFSLAHLSAAIKRLARMTAFK